MNVFFIYNHCTRLINLFHVPLYNNNYSFTLFFPRGLSLVNKIGYHIDFFYLSYASCYQYWLLLLLFIFIFLYNICYIYSPELYKVDKLYKLYYTFGMCTTIINVQIIKCKNILYYTNHVILTTVIRFSHKK